MAQNIRRLILSIALALAPVSGYSLESLGAHPSWSELSNQQRIILAPFSTSWNNMDAYSRKKWLAIAKRYPSMGTEEKMRTQSHMAEWVKLTPEERKHAREKYKSLSRASPNQKATLKRKWHEYQSLPESEKNRLKSATKHQGKNHPASKASTLPVKKKLSRIQSIHYAAPLSFVTIA